MDAINEIEMNKEGQDDYLDAYKKYLEELANNQSSALFANAGKEHASILMSLLFNHTVSDVRIFSPLPYPKFHQSYIFLLKKRNLDISLDILANQQISLRIYNAVNFFFNSLNIFNLIHNII